jgi:hypothetical protein
MFGTMGSRSRSWWTRFGAYQMRNAIKIGSIVIVIVVVTTLFCSSGSSFMLVVIYIALRLGAEIPLHFATHPPAGFGI